MTRRLLVTAFKPYQSYPWNVSAEALRAITEGVYFDGSGQEARLVYSGPRRGFDAGLYDVDFDSIEADLHGDLTSEIGAVLLMGQAPGRATIDLERFAVNAGVRPGSDGDWFPLEDGGPEALKSDLPLDDWTRRLKEQGLPARQSFHAGTFLCNASLYRALRNFERRGVPRAAVFLHLPVSQEHFPDAEVTLPAETIFRAVAATVDLALEWIGEQESRESRTLA